MKKNLRIVSVAAAALLAVAPVAATAVSTVNADAVGGASTPLPNNSDVQISSSVAGLTTKNGSSYTNGRISGTITATYNGSNYSANFSSSNNGVAVLVNGTELSPSALNAIERGNAVTVSLNDSISFNFGSSNANKTITVKTDKNGVVTFGKAQVLNVKVV